ncbi:MAG: aspartate-semialdehyde dehydrogenase [Actinomycetota bacterium]
MRVAVVGATGAVGRMMLRILEERRFPADEVLAFASERSIGVRLPYGGDQLTVRSEAEADAEWGEIDLGLFSAGADRSRALAPPATKAGTVVVDNSSAFRMHPEVPLVIPEINPEALDGHTGLIANPNCTAIAALMAVAPLHRRAGLATLVLSSYQSVSGAGHKGVQELAEQVAKLSGSEEMLSAPDPDALPVGEVFGRTIAFNILPRIDSFEDDASTKEERKIGEETRKILDLPELPVAATAVRVPVLVAHSVSIYARFERPIDPDEARGLLAEASGVEVVDEPSADRYPTPLDAAGKDDVLVGRIRQPAGEPTALLLFAIADNLRKGAALNAVQIAELVTAR